MGGSLHGDVSVAEGMEVVTVKPSLIKKRYWFVTRDNERREWVIAFRYENYAEVEYLRTNVAYIAEKVVEMFDECGFEP